MQQGFPGEYLVMDSSQVGKAMKAAECDEVKRLGLLEPLQAVRHGFRITVSGQ
jgi:hypothetical protein